MKKEVTIPLLEKETSTHHISALKELAEARPTLNSQSLRKANFATLAEAMNYGAQGETGYNFAAAAESSGRCFHTSNCAKRRSFWHIVFWVSILKEAAELR
jgi:hypothetical protein